MGRIKALNVPDRGGYVHFHDLLQALGREVNREKGKKVDLPKTMLTEDTEVGRNIMDAQKSAFSDNLLDPSKDGDMELSIEMTFAAMQIQTAIKRKLHNKHLAQGKVGHFTQLENAGRAGDRAARREAIAKSLTANKPASKAKPFKAEVAFAPQPNVMGARVIRASVPTVPASDRPACRRRRRRRRSRAARRLRRKCVRRPRRTAMDRESRARLLLRPPRARRRRRVWKRECGCEKGVR